MRLPLTLAALLLAAHAGAGALDDCTQAVANMSEMPACLAQRLKTAEHKLAQAESRTLTQMRELDQVTDGRYRAARALEQGQRAFRAYRKAQCAWVAASYASGNGAGHAQAACQIDLTEQRLQQLSGE